MSIQYPHKLYFQTVQAPHTDGGGNWVPGTPASSWEAATELEMDCCDQPSDKGRETTVVDGDVVEFGSIVYCELAVPDLKRGDRVRITHNGKVRLEGKIQRVSRDYYHVRLWV